MAHDVGGLQNLQIVQKGVHPHCFLSSLKFLLLNSESLMALAMGHWAHVPINLQQFNF